MHAAERSLSWGVRGSNSIENRVVRRSLVRSNEVVDHCPRHGSSDFETNQAIVVCSGFKNDRTGAALFVEFNFGKNVLCGRALERWPAEEKIHRHNMASDEYLREGVSNRARWFER